MGAETTYNDLPTECLLRILNFLTLPDIAALLRTSKLWNSIINANEQTLYHQLAEDLDAASIKLGSLLDALDGWLSQEANKVRGWKDYCRLRVITERRWEGKERPYSTTDAFKSVQQTRVGWIKIDTEKGLLVMAGDEEADEDNCVVVHCLRDPMHGALFHLKQARNNILAPGHGLLNHVFGNVRVGSDSFEVWRWAEDQAISQMARQPTDEQSQKYECALLSAGIHESPCRGELLPMGVLKQPDEPRAYRLVYPTLCAGSHAGDQLWLWDVRTRHLTQTIHIEPSPYQQFSMMYVDVNESHVFVATHTVSIYSRATSECVFQLKEAEMRRLACYVTPPVPNYDSNSIFQEYILPGYHDPNINVTPPYLLDIVVAVRASPTGDNCVAITHWGYIVLINGLKHEALELADSSSPTSIGVDMVSVRKIERLSVLANIKISLARAEGTLLYLAYDGRRILAFGSHGLVLVNLNRRGCQANSFEILFSDRTPAKLTPFPVQTMYLVPPFAGEADIYRGCTCLQMTADSCWIAWSPEGHESLVISIYAHVEMSDGFVVFTCGAEAPDSLEVWRWAEDQDARPLDSSPTEKQQQLYENATINQDRDSPRRGVLVPMGVLKHSDQTRASRLVYPTVCVGNQRGDCLSLWDIRTRKLTQTIEIEPSPYMRFRMNYVDVNETHVFVATHTVSVYSRATKQRVFFLEESYLAQVTTYLSAPIQISSKDSAFRKRELPGYTIADRPMISGHRPWDVIMAIHVAPDGNDFVAITSQGHVFHMSGLKSGAAQARGGGSHHFQAHLKISAAQVQSCLENLAYDGQRILAYGDMGLCLLNLEDRPQDCFHVPLGDGVVGDLYPFPTKTLNFVYPFGGLGHPIKDVGMIYLVQTVSLS
ncbi:unnamed protein product [Rhizoctonia solani]|uniref:F-box domain-containing protein n=1 Tax=Rhizoctonia solani TaxID=456999 RepID=A0A8H3DC82_9AGAM|nr:unnamed protein product [Rhizoctonia solani]